ncbi:hypothetical protein CRYUN_Cryun13aG0117200 [Craigia yunnanensis]
MSGHDSKYFSTTKKGEIPELKEELNTHYKDKRKDAVKKVIAAMTVGKDVASLIHRIQILSFVLWLFGLWDASVLIIITEYLCDPLQRCLKDDDPYVRKTAAISNAVAALAEIQENSNRPIFQITSHTLSKLLTALNECTEQKGPEEEELLLGGIRGCEIEELMVADGLMATHLDDMIEIIIRGVGKEDHVLVLHMVGEEMIMTRIEGAESTPCLVMAMVIVDERRKSFSDLNMVGERDDYDSYRRRRECSKSSDGSD